VPGWPGKYHWIAVVNGPGTGGTSVNNVLPQTHNGDCSQHATEDVVVQQIPTTTITAQSWVPNDAATVAASASGGSAIAGTIRFQLYPNGTCNTADPTIYDKTFGTALNPLVAGADGKIHQSTDNTAAITSPGKTVSWSVTFTSTEASHTGSSNSCNEQSILTVDDDTTTP